MILENIPDPDNVVEMIRFWVNFAVSPTKALASYEGLGDISLALFLLMGSGLLISVFIVYILGKMGWAAHSAMTKAIFGDMVSNITGRDLKPHELVPAVTLFMFALVVVLHLLAVSWVWIDQRIRLLSSNFGGSIFDSLNAAAAFLAFFIPLATVCAIAAGVHGRTRPDNANRIAVGISIGLGIVFLIYLPWALSAVHPDTTYFQAMAALGGWPVGIIVLGTLVTALWRVIRWASPK